MERGRQLDDHIMSAVKLAPVNTSALGVCYICNLSICNDMRTGPLLAPGPGLMWSSCGTWAGFMRMYQAILLDPALERKSLTPSPTFSGYYAIFLVKYLRHLDAFSKYTPCAP
jgi:hypothetical protein